MYRYKVILILEQHCKKDENAFFYCDDLHIPSLSPVGEVEGGTYRSGTPDKAGPRLVGSASSTFLCPKIDTRPKR